jgi:HEAT repeat protein
MRRLRPLIWFALALICGFGLLVSMPNSRFVLRAVVRNEEFYEDRPLGYWAHQLKDRDPARRVEAIKALNAMGEKSKGAVPELTEALNDPDDYIRLTAALALSKIGPDAVGAVDALAKALSDSHPQVRMNSAMALTRIGPGSRAAVPQMIAAMKRDENREVVRPFYHCVRQQLANALGVVGPEAATAVPVLIDALTDPDNGVRFKAVDALRKIGPAARPACDQIRKCWKNERETKDVREAAQKALETLAPDDPELMSALKNAH